MVEYNPYIIFHWGNISIGAEIWKTKIIPWLNKYKQTKIYITHHKNKYDCIKNIIAPFHISVYSNTIIFDNFIFMFEVPNIGMDIGPFFYVIKYILNNNIQDDIKLITFIKIHTKTDQFWRNNLINPLLDINIDKSLITKWIDNNIGIYIPTKYKYKLDNLNTSTINEIISTMKNISFDIKKAVNQTNEEFIIYKQQSKLHDNKKLQTNIIDYSFDYEFYKNFNNIDCYYDNETDIINFLNYHWKNVGKYRNLLYNKAQLQNNKELVNQSELTNIKDNSDIISKPKQYYFSAGTMFWIKGDIIYKFFSKFDFDKHINLLESGYTLNDKPTYVHAWERIISLIPVFYNKKEINDL